MLRRSRGPVLAFVFCMLWQSVPAFANCAAVLELAQMYNAFHAVTHEGGDIRARAAARLYPRLANLDVDAFVDGADAGLSHGDIVEALEMARTLARDVITNNDLSPFQILDARDEAQALARFVEDSGCLNDGRGGMRAENRVGHQEDQSGKRTLQFGPKSKSGGAKTFVDESKVSVLALLVIGGAAGLAGGAFLVLRSRPVKVYRAERQPRHRISLSFDVFCAPGDGPAKNHKVTAQDVSVGGMKLRVPEPLPKGMLLEIALPIGAVKASVIWCNSHYAGILFEKWLGEEDIQAIIAAT